MVAVFAMLIGRAGSGDGSYFLVFEKGIICARCDIEFVVKQFLIYRYSVLYPSCLGSLEINVLEFNRVLASIAKLLLNR